MKKFGTSLRTLLTTILIMEAAIITVYSLDKLEKVLVYKLKKRKEEKAEKQYYESLGRMEAIKKEIEKKRKQLLLINK